MSLAFDARQILQDPEFCRNFASSTGNESPRHPTSKHIYTCLFSQHSSSNSLPSSSISSSTTDAAAHLSHQPIHPDICRFGQFLKTTDVRLAHIPRNNSLHPSVNQMSAGSNPNDFLTSKNHTTMIICPNPITEIIIRILTRGR